LTGTAVKFTGIPEQTGFVDADIVILTGKTGFTVIVIALLVAGLPMGQVAFEFNTHVIISPFKGV